MVCHELEAEAIDVLMEAFARPDESECFFLGLAVPAFDFGERSAGVAGYSARSLGNWRYRQVDVNRCLVPSKFSNSFEDCWEMLLQG